MFLTRKKSVRSEAGERIHQVIVGYILDKASIEEVAKVFTEHQHQVSALQEISVNGFTHLLDIVHLPYRFHTDEPVANLKTANLIKVFFEFVKHADAISFNLLQSSKLKNNNPLHILYRYAHADVIQVFFQQVIRAFTNNVITVNDLNRLMMSRNDTQFTILLQALKTANENIIIPCFELIHQCYLDKILNRENICELMTAANKYGYTPLSAALVTNNISIIINHLKLIEKFYHLCAITLDKIFSMVNGLSSHLNNQLLEIIKHNNLQAKDPFHSINLVVKSTNDGEYSSCNKRIIQLRHPYLLSRNKHTLFAKNNDLKQQTNESVLLYNNKK